MVRLLRGKTLTWARTLSLRTHLSSLTFDELEVNIKAVFNRPNYASNATDRPLSIHQGARRVAEYTVEFWKLAVEAGWNESPLQGFFFAGA